MEHHPLEVGAGLDTPADDVAANPQLSDAAIPVVPWPIIREDSALGFPGRTTSRNALRRDATFRRLLASADILAAVVSLAAMTLIGDAWPPRFGLLLAVPVLVVAAKTLGLYDRDELVFHKSTLDEAPALFELATLYALLISLLHSTLFDGTVGSTEVLLFWATFFVADLVLRLLGRRVARRVAAPERCLIVGKSSARVRLAAKLGQAHSRLLIIGALPLSDERTEVGERRSEERSGGDRRRRQLHIEDLDDLVSELDIHRVIIIPGSGDPEEMLDSIGHAKAIGVKVSIVPRLFEVVGSSVEFDDLEGLTVLGVRRFGLTRSSSALKRTVDIVASALGLLVLSPLFALVAVLIRLDSRGPVFFLQTRVGLDGQFFQMVKFRSMVKGAEHQRAELGHLNETDGLFKIARDPRVTRVGRVIRRTAIDELPQLVNVLRGDMSLVGPRPLVVDEDARVEGRHRGRLKLVPGMTGPWQLLGPGRVPLNEMVTIDYLYGANWSLWNDLKILIRTAAYVINREGV